MSGVGGVGGDQEIQGLDAATLEAAQLGQMAETQEAPEEAGVPERQKMIGGSTGFRVGLLAQQFEVDAAGGDSQAISDATATFQDAIKQSAQDPETFGAILKQAFGSKIDDAALADLQQKAESGEFPLPDNIRFVDPEVLQGNNAAYSPEGGGTVYLSRDLADDPKAMAAAIAEEAGHHLDQILGGNDTQGDEGEIFRLALEKGGPLDANVLEGILHDYDQGSIEVDGAKVDVEFWGTIEGKGKGSPATYLDAQTIIFNSDATKVGKWLEDQTAKLETGLKRLNDQDDELTAEDFATQFEKPFFDELKKLTANKKFPTLLSKMSADNKAKFLAVAHKLEGHAGEESDLSEANQTALQTFSSKVTASHGKDAKKALLGLNTLWGPTLMKIGLEDSMNTIKYDDAIKGLATAEFGVLTKELFTGVGEKALGEALDKAGIYGKVIKKGVKAYDWLKEKVVDDGGIVGATTNVNGHISVTVINTNKGTVSTMIFKQDTPNQVIELSGRLQGKIGASLSPKNIGNLQVHRNIDGDREQLR